MAAERPVKRRRISPPSENSTSIPGFAKWNLEQDYEQRPRRNKKKKEQDRLPVKKEDKWIEAAPEEIGKEQSSEGEDESGVDNVEKDSAIADVQPRRRPKKPKLPPKEEIRQAKEELARIAGLISESPEEHVGLLKSLAEIAESENSIVQKLVLGTQLAVYKDIIPGYRIGPLSRDDLEAKLSKDVRNLRNFEQSLLGGYKNYVQSLDRLSRSDSQTYVNLASVAVACACMLLTSVSHFNMRNELIGILVRKLSGRSVDADFVKCREALEQLFQDDEEGHTSLEVVNQLTQMMKTKKYNVNEGVLNTFLHLRLLSEFTHKASTNHIDKGGETNGRLAKKAKQKREFRSKRERKALRERKEVEKEMKEADAAVSFEERDKNQAETLKLVFVAYFRILKARTPHLMGAVLEGLAKYAHLINQDFFGDVLEALKDLINDASASFQDDGDGDGDDDDVSTPHRNATRESLLCIITAFALLQGQHDVAKSANSLHLDLNFFITHLYRTLLPLSMDQDIELSSKPTHLHDPNSLPVPTLKTAKVNVVTTTVLLLRSLSAVLLPPTSTKMVPPLRIAAFVKQLHTLALHLPPKSAAAVMGLLQQVSKVHGPRIAALWNTEERRGDGVFLAESGEVEASNPFAATVWEGELLRLHFDPRVREGWRGVERNVVEAR